MATLKKALGYFEQAQVIAMKDGNDFNELIALGLMELVQSLDADLTNLQRDVQSTVSQTRGLSR